MTLTLEQVRQTRFHLARRNGYEPVDVDNFAAFATLYKGGRTADAAKRADRTVDAAGDNFFRRGKSSRGTSLLQHCAHPFVSSVSQRAASNAW